MISKKFENVYDFYDFIVDNIGTYDFGFIRNLKNNENYSLVEVSTDPLTIVLKQLSTGKYIYLTDEKKEINIEIDFIDSATFFQRYVRIDGIYNQVDDEILDFICNVNHLNKVLILDTYNGSYLKIVFEFNDDFKIFVFIELFKNLINDSELISKLKKTKEVKNKIKSYLLEEFSKNNFFTF